MQKNILLFFVFFLVLMWPKELLANNTMVHEFHDVNITQIITYDFFIDANEERPLVIPIFSTPLVVKKEKDINISSYTTIENLSNYDNFLEKGGRYRFDDWGSLYSFFLICYNNFNNDIGQYSPITNIKVNVVRHTNDGEINLILDKNYLENDDEIHGIYFYGDNNFSFVYYDGQHLYHKYKADVVRFDSNLRASSIYSNDSILNKFNGKPLDSPFKESNSSSPYYHLDSKVKGLMDKSLKDYLNTLYEEDKLNYGNAKYITELPYSSFYNISTNSKVYEFLGDKSKEGGNPSNLSELSKFLEKSLKESLKDNYDNFIVFWPSNNNYLTIINKFSVYNYVLQIDDNEEYRIIKNNNYGVRRKIGFVEGRLDEIDNKILKEFYQDKNFHEYTLSELEYRRDELREIKKFVDYINLNYPEYISSNSIGFIDNDIMLERMLKRIIYINSDIGYYQEGIDNAISTRINDETNLTTRIWAIKSIFASGLLSLLIALGIQWWSNKKKRDNNNKYEGNYFETDVNMNPEIILGIEEKIGHTFTNKRFLESALTTNAYLKEHAKEIGPEKEITHYKKLEPIGDSILDLIVTSELSKSKEKLNYMEKVTTKDRFIKEKDLEIIAKRMGLNRFLRMGNGEIKKNIQDNKKVCDALVEALIAAVYLDCIDHEGKVDMIEVRKVIVENLGIFNNDE